MKRSNAIHLCCALFLMFIALLAPDFAHAGGQTIGVTGLTDLNFGSWSGSGNLVGTRNVCIVKPNGNNRYDVTASGSGAGSSFRLASGANTLTYGVQFQGSTGGQTTLTATVTVQFQAASNTCPAGTNATITVTILSTALDAAPSGTYTGTLTLVLQP